MSGSVWRVPGMGWLLGSVTLALGFAGLLAFTGAAAASRWGAGGIADRFGPTPAIAPLLFAGALGLAAIALGAVGGVHDAPGRALVMSGLLLAGVAYGGLQNLTLTQAFTAAGEAARSSVSIVWNLSFDAGTGIGAFATGAVATTTSYSAAFCGLALAAGIVGGYWALPITARLRDNPPIPHSRPRSSRPTGSGRQERR